MSQVETPLDADDANARNTIKVLDTIDPESRQSLDHVAAGCVPLLVDFSAQPLE